MNVEDKNPQEIGSQITYARRYTLKSLFNLSDVDDDGNAASGKSVVTTVDIPKAIAPTKPELKGNTPQSEALKKEYNDGTLTHFSQITDRYFVSEPVKLGIKQSMPNLKF